MDHNIFSDLLRWFNDYIMAQEKTNARKEIETSQPGTSQQKKPSSTHGDRPKTLENFSIQHRTPQQWNKGGDRRRNETKCYFCQRDHHTRNCDKNLSPKMKRMIANKSKLCFNCLSDSHLSSECRSENRCQECRGKHHTSIHVGRSQRDVRDGKSSRGRDRLSDGLRSSSKSGTRVVPTSSIERKTMKKRMIVVNLISIVYYLR